MIYDHIRNLKDYEGMGLDVGRIQDFIERSGREALPPGKYELDGEDLFVMIQEYETGDEADARFESHRLYGDIQYVEKGEEAIYYADAASLPIAEDRTPKEDICFHESGERGICLGLCEGYFALFLPQDAHKPCCSMKEKKKVRKLVFKFRIPKGHTV